MCLHYLVKLIAQVWVAFNPQIGLWTQSTMYITNVILCLFIPVFCASLVISLQDYHYRSYDCCDYGCNLQMPSATVWKDSSEMTHCVSGCK